MSVVGNQQQIWLQLTRTLQPHWRSDPNLPSRIHTLLARRREFGSRDRRLYRELLYTALRYLPWVEPHLAGSPPRAVEIVAWLAADTRDTAAYRSGTVGAWPRLFSLAEKAAYLGKQVEALFPRWVAAEFPAFSAGEQEAQLARAPLWLRLQTTDADRVAEEFREHGWNWQPASQLACAWKMSGEPDVSRSAAFTRGDVEVQDLGSQMVLESLGLEPGGHWLDACAGAGGKTLQLARLLGPEGMVDAHDVRDDALDELVVRAERTHVRSSRPGRPGEPDVRVAFDEPQRTAATIRVLRPRSLAADAASRVKLGGNARVYDGVLVDAPCSGSGTWRRSPHLKWLTTPEMLQERAATQRQLLKQFSALVRPGGRLVYATCSLARTENQAVVAAFLREHRDFLPEPFARTFGFSAIPEGLTILPGRHDTDGFFVASLRRTDAPGAPPESHGVSSDGPIAAATS